MRRAYLDHLAKLSCVKTLARESRTMLEMVGDSENSFTAACNCSLAIPSADVSWRIITILHGAENTFHAIT